jgi:3',5'-cyclic AMP phosphodiesterase CpdA
LKVSNATKTSRDDTTPLSTFLHIADIHFWQLVWKPWQLLNKRMIGNLNVIIRRRKHYAMALAEAHGRQIASAGVPFAVLTGDFTSTAIKGEFERARVFVEALAQAQIGVAVLPGNHDVYTFGALRTDRCRRYLGAFMPDRYPARQLLPGGVALVLAPTVRPSLWHSRGRISPEDIAETAELVQSAPEGPVIVAAHYPVLKKTAAYESPWQRGLAHAEELRRALGATGRRILYVAGHVHRFSLTRDDAFPGMSHLTTGALIQKRAQEATQGEYSEVRVFPGHFEVVRHRCQEAGWTSEIVEHLGA